VLAGNITTYWKSEKLLEAWTINAVDSINKDGNQPTFLQFSTFVVINRALSLYISQFLQFSHFVLNHRPLSFYISQFCFKSVSLNCVLAVKHM
jgi:hypothetical protein